MTKKQLSAFTRSFIAMLIRDAIKKKEYQPCDMNEDDAEEVEKRLEHIADTYDLEKFDDPDHLYTAITTTYNHQT